MTATSLQSVFPVLRYRDARAAIEWLTAVLGAEKGAIYEGDGDSIAHAQLRWGASLITLGSERDDGGLVVDAGRPWTYLVVDEPSEIDAIHERCVEAGATVVMPPTDQDYGSRDVTVLDPERNVWSIGTHRPGS